MKKLIVIFLLMSLRLFAGEKDVVWPSTEFTHVVGYCYDYTKDTRGAQIVFPDKTLHRGVIRATTVRLEAEQTAALRKILVTPVLREDEIEENDCHYPHHAFVFYDAEWKPVAWVDVCFLCASFAPVPSNEASEVSELLDWRALEKFCREIGLPVFEDEKDYAKLYESENSKEVRLKLPKDPDSEDPFANSDDPDVDPFE